MVAAPVRLRGAGWPGGSEFETRVVSASDAVRLDQVCYLPSLSDVLTEQRHGYDAVPMRFVAVSFDALDPEALGVFWAGVLGRKIVEEADGVLLPGSDTQVGLRFIATTTETPGRNRLHLHLTSSTAEDQWRTVEAVLRLGGHRFGTKPLPIGRDDVFLADPGGNEFCVIEPGNDYLAGCGLLGEFTCDGTREVGLFWRDALGWPLVWNQGKQTAIQSPRGGTKISWDSWSAAPKNGRDRQQFHLAAPEPAVEADRLSLEGPILKFPPRRSTRNTWTTTP
jgi:hypothetical protein